MDNVVKVYEKHEVQVIDEKPPINCINYEQEILKTCCEQEEIEKLKAVNSWNGKQADR